jgi:hypothetical protein
MPGNILCLIVITTLLTGAQTKIPINMCLVEKGTANGISAGEKVIVYNKKGNETLEILANGYINGFTTNVKNTTTTAQTTIWVTPQVEIKNAGRIKQAKLFNILGEEVKQVIADRLNTEKIIPLINLATEIYYLQIVEESGENYTLKLF